MNVFTNNRTAKRIKISELATLSRAKKGNLLMKKVKSAVYYIIKAFITNSRDIICLEFDNEIKEIKNSDISIMDLASTGSSISKYNLEEIFIKTEKKSYIKKKPVESIEESQVKKEEVKEFTMDDFLDDFKL